MITKTEMKQFGLQVGHAPVRRLRVNAEKKTHRITGSIFRDCLTTITRA